MALPANCQWLWGSGTSRMWAASATRSVTMRPRIRSRITRASVEKLSRFGLVTSRRKSA